MSATVNEDALTDGSYDLTFVDMIRNRAAQAGDVLKISVDTDSAFIDVESVRYTVSPQDVRRSQIRLPDLIARHIPTETKLLANYPNPFNPETWIPFHLAKDALVTVAIYDAPGRRIRFIEVGHRPAAAYASKERAVYWDGRNDFGEQIASGVYFYSLTAGAYTETRKMVILK